jgi:hypothetical protein
MLTFIHQSIAPPGCWTRRRQSCAFLLKETSTMHNIAIYAPIDKTVVHPDPAGQSEAGAGRRYRRGEPFSVIRLRVRYGLSPRQARTIAELAGFSGAT